ncbi:MAG: DNA gyrase inhibitor YacG [Rhizobiales bacterium]|nr:DNA gyrase inhibitor YacG [Hyphomicrobiales bacterium]MPZ59589.1 DNA gyrase inhibitor YacG [Hyphomicrobiales bacterium]
MSDHASSRAVGRCPICARPVADQFRPFCSKRCRDVDLNRWLSGVYAVPGKEDEDEDGLRDDGAPENERG